MNHTPTNEEWQAAISRQGGWYVPLSGRIASRTRSYRRGEYLELRKENIWQFRGEAL